MAVEYRVFLVIVAKLLFLKKLKKRKKERKREREKERKKERKTNSHKACVASVSAGVRRECWDGAKKRPGMKKEEMGRKGTSYPLPLLLLLLCFAVAPTLAQ